MNEGKHAEKEKKEKNKLEGEDSTNNSRKQEGPLNSLDMNLVIGTERKGKENLHRRAFN